MCLFDARADHLCLDALKVVLRSLSGVKVLLDKGVVVARRGVTLGAIVTLGRVEERRVDAWDWALALSGIFVVVCQCAVVGVQRAFEPGGCVTPCYGPAAAAVGCRKVRGKHQPCRLSFYGRNSEPARVFAWIASVLQAASALCFWQLFWLVQPCELL